MLGVNVRRHSRYLAVVLWRWSGRHGEVEREGGQIVVSQVADAVAQFSGICFTWLEWGPGEPVRFQAVGADGDPAIYKEPFAIHNSEGVVVDAAWVNSLIEAYGHRGKRVGVAAGRQKCRYLR